MADAVITTQGSGKRFSFTLLCGCELVHDGPGATFTYCPMHKAAPKMFRALNRCEGAMDRLNGDTGTAKRPCWFCLADQYDGAVGIIHDAEDCEILEARKALATARGKEVEA